MSPTRTDTTMVERFRSLHQAERPLLLVNCWDVGSAVATARAGAPAVATSSWAVAAARGEQDGERLGLAAVLAVAKAVAGVVEVPVTIDLERGYADDATALREVAREVVETGAVGINLEDGKPTGLREEGEAAERISAVVDGAFGGLFVNARTDVFLTTPAEEHAGLVDAALSRAGAYAAAGAEGFFVPGLVDAGLVARVVSGSPLPVNVMVSTREQVAELAAAGASRISIGPAAYLAVMETLGSDARAWLGSLA